MKHAQTYADRIAGILSGLDRLRETDLRTTVVSLGDREVIGYRCRIHGAAVHRYEHAAPADPDVLSAFENRLGAGLPADYFEWITRVGDGGAGPMLGLLPLAQEAEDAAIDYAADFPFTAERPCPPAAAPPRCRRSTREPLTFLDWYELWLARALDPDVDQVGSFAEFTDHGAYRA